MQQTKISQILTKPGMQYGPYLVFLRSRIGFTGPHGFDEWDCMDGILYQQMWGTDTLVTMFSTPQELVHIGEADAPDWVDILEIASIAVDHAGQRLPVPEEDLAVIWDDEDNDEEETFLPSVENLMRFCRPGATPDKAAFDRRLMLILFDEPDDRRNAGTLDAVKRRLGKSAVGVWYGRDMFGIAFRDQRQPAQILESLRDILSRAEIFDAGIFKLCAAASLRAAVSPLQDFLESRPPAGSKDKRRG